MKLKTTKNLTVEVTPEEILSLLTRLVEKKSGKKVSHAGVSTDGTYVLELVPEEEVTNLDEPKA
jgi:hypothetical protein